MPKPTRYYYWQPLPYRPEYLVFLRFSDLTFKGVGSSIARVTRDRSTWYAGNETDPDAAGVGKTRDEAVDNLLKEIGGLG